MKSTSSFETASKAEDRSNVTKEKVIGGENLLPTCSLRSVSNVGLHDLLKSAWEVVGTAPITIFVVKFSTVSVPAKCNKQRTKDRIFCFLLDSMNYNRYGFTSRGLFVAWIQALITRSRFRDFFLDLGTFYSLKALDSKRIEIIKLSFTRRNLQFVLSLAPLCTCFKNPRNYKNEILQYGCKVCY